MIDIRKFNDARIDYRDIEDIDLIELTDDRLFQCGFFVTEFSDPISETPARGLFIDQKIVRYSPSADMFISESGLVFVSAIHFHDLGSFQRRYHFMTVVHPSKFFNHRILDVYLTDRFIFITGLFCFISFFFVIATLCHLDMYLYILYGTESGHILYSRKVSQRPPCLRELHTLLIAGSPLIDIKLPVDLACIIQITPVPSGVFILASF